MKTTIFTIVFAAICGAMSAQPKWAKKVSKSIFTLKTFGDDGSLVGSSNGFFISDDGVAVGSFAPFKGASKAVVIDADGKEYEVECLLGANDIYDISKFRVATKKSVPIAVAATPIAEGQNAWILPYSKGNAGKSGSVRKVETALDDHKYYTVGTAAPANSTGCPLTNDAGEAVGIMQQSVEGDTLCYAVDISFPQSLKISGLSLGDAALRSTKVKIALPDDLDQAILMMYIANSSVDSAKYATMVDDFMAKYPQAPNGYGYKATLEANAANYDAATANVDKAIAIDPQPTYRRLKAEILIMQRKYGEAYDIYDNLLKSDGRTTDNYLAAADCQLVMGDTTLAVALADSAMTLVSRPYLKESARHILAHAQIMLDAGKYRSVVNDYNDYETLMPTEVNDNFYYLRHQAEIGGKLFQQALNDINKAISMNPTNALYYAEKASLQIRVGLKDDAIDTANELIALDKDNSDGYLFLGLAQCLKGDKTAGVANLKKAQALGDTQAEALIGKYGN